jgi:spore germination protein GerM
MAAQKGAGKKPNPSHKTSSPRKKPIGVLFWAAFFILVTGLFLVNREVIRKTIRDTHLMDRVFNSRSEPEQTNTPDTPQKRSSPDVGEGDGSPVASSEANEGPPSVRLEEPAVSESVKPLENNQRPAGQSQRNPETSGQPPAVQPAPLEAPKTETGPSRPRAAEALKERSLYFTQIDRDGTIMRVKVIRQFPSSDSPMLDALQVLLRGPTTEEQRRDILSLIPQGTKILSAVVRGDTAYINFSEDFQYNTYGVEGYAAQLKQIVWTATEFSNVKDVQILIEGRRIDYLGEGIWIGGPVNRDGL